MFSQKVSSYAYLKRRICSTYIISTPAASAGITNVFDIFVGA